MNRKKPTFVRRDWHKRIRFTRKKKMKWRKARGMDNKVRLAFKGYPSKVKIGWGRKSEEKGLVKGLTQVRIENVKQLESVKKGQGVIIGKVGKKNREALIKKANEMKITVLNKYKVMKNATS